MTNFNSGNFIPNFRQPPSQFHSEGAKTQPGQNIPANNPPIPNDLPGKHFLNQGFMQHQPMTMLNFKMNNLANLDRSLYIKNMMNFPKDMQELLIFIQNNLGNTKDLQKLLTKNIDIAELSLLMQQNGKEAMTKLIKFMAEASKQGINDLSEIKDAIKLINASISVAGQENSNQTIKNFMLLYLPWLPLQEGVDFDLEIEGSESSENADEMSLTIMVSTRNYGNVKAVLTLLSGNSINIYINCSEDFPKKELLKFINEENKKYSIKSDVIFDEKKVQKQENTAIQAKVNMSSLKEVNPFLLLVANSLIRHTIELDNMAG